MQKGLILSSTAKSLQKAFGKNPQRRYLSKRTIPLLLGIISSSISRGEPIVPPALEWYETKVDVKQGDTITDILFQYGVGKKSSAFKIYGLKGLAHWNQSYFGVEAPLKPNHTLRLYLPKNHKNDAAQVSEYQDIFGTYTLHALLYKPNPDTTTRNQQILEMLSTLKLSDAQMARWSMFNLRKGRQLRLKEQDDHNWHVLLYPKYEETDLPSKQDKPSAKAPMDDVTKLDPLKTPEKEEGYDLDLKKYTDQFGNLLDQANSHLFENTASGMIGFRIGSSYSSSPDSLGGKLRPISLLLELRGGALKGLRYYYESIPTAEGKVLELDSSFSWSRWFIGWAFEVDLGYYPYFPNKAHLTPRVGEYSMSSTLPASTSQTRVFETSSSLSLGFEIDLEWSRPDYIFRPWYAFGTSGVGGQQSAISGNRFGTDLVLEGGRVELLSLGLTSNYLLYFAYETIGLEGETLENKEAFSLDFNFSHFGIGYSVAW